MELVSAKLVDIWRHPIKAHGRERITSARLTIGEALPHDRIWAVAHDLSKFDPSAPDWVPCPNFQRAARTPEVMAITSTLEEATGQITLTHPQIGTYVLAPESEESRTGFIAWLRPISPSARFTPVALVRGPRAITDTSRPTLSINSTSSLAALSAYLGQEIAPERWRGNLWVEGLAPWTEEELVGKKIRLGSAILEVTQPIERCMATAANPLTGLRDADTLGALRALTDKQNFGVFAEVIENGTIALGDRLEVL